MRSKYYFIVRDILVILAAVAIFLISLALVSLIFFALRDSGLSILPRFGTAGFKIFITLFPWIPVIIAFVLTFLLSLVLKSYSFAYRKPLLYLPIGLIAILVAAGRSVLGGGSLSPGERRCFFGNLSRVRLGTNYSACCSQRIGEKRRMICPR